MKLFSPGWVGSSCSSPQIIRRVTPLWLLFCVLFTVTGCGDLFSSGGAATATPPAFVIVDATPAPAAATTPGAAATTAAPPTAAPLPTAAATATLVATAIPSPPPALATGAPELRLSANTLVAIFRGQITNWNDERIRADNPGLQLPDLPIRVVYRSDASGTTRAVTEYLVAVNQEWRDSIGAAYRLGDAGSQPWPVGEGTNGSSGVTRFVQNTPGAIGYVATAFAAEAGLPLATLQNAAGNWVSPDSSTIREAANNTVNALDERLRGFSVNAPGANAYPISIYTWAISCPAGLSLEQAQALSDFLYWAITDPQAIAEARNLGYEPVPASVQQRVLAQLEAIEINGTRAFAAPTSGQFQPRSFSPLVAISGAGSTLAGPLYQALSQRYAQVQPSVQLNYTPQGSTAGQEGLLQQGSIQFAGTEEAVVDNDVQITRAACQPAPLHVPVAVGAVGIVYNVPRP